MSKKNKIILVSLGIALVLGVMVSVSYALYIFNVSQTSSNVVRADCFEITYSDMNPIDLSASIPLSDSEAMELTPYTFTISNICNYSVDYNINVETLTGSTMSLDGVKARINGYKPLVLGTVEDNDSSVVVNSNAVSSKTIKHGSMTAGASKTFNLRLYIDENSTYEQTGNKTYSSKVVVSAKLNPKYSEAILVNGSNFSRTLKVLSGTPSATYATGNTNIVSIKRSLVAPSESDNASVISLQNSSKPVYAWFNNGDIYIYSEATKIMMNPDSSNMFYGLSGVTTIDLSMFDTSNVTNMSQMFYALNALESIDVSTFDTSNVTNMYRMFSGLFVIPQLDLSGFDTSNVTNMSNIFSSLKSVTSLNLSSFDTSSVENMYCMFSGMTHLSFLDISSFNTSNVTNMGYMFRDLRLLENLDLSNFDTSKVTNMEGMFYGMTNLSFLDLSSFNTSNVTNMSWMFNSVHNLTSLDLSNFDSTSLLEMNYMFQDAYFTTIYVGYGWNVSDAVDGTGAFTSANRLVGGSGTAYSNSHRDSDYAHVDCGEGYRGYFTFKGNMSNYDYCASIGHEPHEDVI